MGYNLKEIYNYFIADGTFLNGEPYGSGHIHDTFRIYYRGLISRSLKTFRSFSTI
jgi:hypothetical protein